MKLTVYINIKMSGKNLPGGLIQIKDNEDGTLSYVFDKFCIFEKGFMNGSYSPLIPLITPPGTAIPVFNYGNSGSTLFYFTDGKGHTTTVNQDAESGNYYLMFPAIKTNDTLVTTTLAQTLTNKTIENPTYNISNSLYGIFKIIDNSGNSISAMQDVPLTTGNFKLNFPAISASDTICLLAQTQTLTNKTIENPTFNIVNSGSGVFTMIDNSGNSISVLQDTLATGAFNLILPTIKGSDHICYLALAQTLLNKTIENPTFNVGNSSNGIYKIIDNLGNSISVLQNTLATGNFNLNYPALTASDTICLESQAQTLTNKTLTSPTINNGTLSTPVFSGTSTGIMQNSSQYCFKAYVSSGGGSSTGDGTGYQIIFNSIDFQVGTGYDTSTGVFTAPINGLYHFTANIQTSGWSSTNDTVQSYFTHNTTKYNMQMTSNISFSETYLVNNFSSTFKMAANDTISVGIEIGGETSGTKNISIVTGSMNTNLIGTLLVALG